MLGTVQVVWRLVMCYSPKYDEAMHKHFKARGELWTIGTSSTQVHGKNNPLGGRRNIAMAVVAREGGIRRYILQSMFLKEYQVPLGFFATMSFLVISLHLVFLDLRIPHSC
jgi:hypothetical protein